MLARLRTFCRRPSVRQLLETLLRNQDIMSTHFGAAFDNLVKSLNDNTNAVAAQFDKLHAELAAAADQGDPITQAQLDSLSAINDHLKALGAVEAAPVPPVPVVAPVVEPVTPVVVVPSAPASVPGSSSLT